MKEIKVDLFPDNVLVRFPPMHDIVGVTLPRIEGVRGLDDWSIVLYLQYRPTVLDRHILRDMDRRERPFIQAQLTRFVLTNLLFL
jgi:hypothetical protein